MASQVGIIGYCCPTGVGIATETFYRQLPFARWLVIEHTRLGVDYAKLDASCRVAGQPTDRDWPAQSRPTSTGDATLDDVDRWLAGLDAVFAVERGYVRGFWHLAKKRGVRTILMPMAEWFRPDDPDMTLVDTFVAPTLACAELLERNGFGARTAYIPYPVDTHQFAFRQRQRASRFLHCRGWGGWAERKGTAAVLEAADRCPEVDFVVRHQAPVIDACPDNVQVLGPTAAPENQYAMGDVAVQPSRWEGVGLQILEAMSCGLPVIVPDAPPMNEYPAEKRLCVPCTGTSATVNGKRWTAYEVDVASLVDVILAFHGSAIGELSRNSRTRIEAQSWDTLRSEFAKHMDM